MRREYRVQIFVIDAFTDAPFRGNPAGVVLGHGDDAWMQSVAAEMKHSETAFVRPRANGHDLRWFTPTIEVDLCGHATLASAHALYEAEGIERTTFHTRSGPLGTVRNDDGSITMDFPATVPEPQAPIAALLDVFGVEPVEFLHTEAEFFMLVLESASLVRKVAPDFERLRRVGGVRGVYVTARSDDPDYDVVSRCFAPAVGIDEDPVTGSMHCVLAAYWCPRLGIETLRGFQGSARGGAMTARLAGDRAHLTGCATTVLRGELTS
ncbi:MAG TPA: PhzF family phenazine biosynthesis protein [Acidimicrobiia bacterium]|nr:PhzF family phenazine biosynthesis protein [Acidimicrobiia bacterium]